jgi:hypothetical protein
LTFLGAAAVVFLELLVVDLAAVFFAAAGFAFLGAAVFFFAAVADADFLTVVVFLTAVTFLAVAVFLTGACGRRAQVGNAKRYKKRDEKGRYNSEL